MAQVRQLKKSETLEIRLPHPAKQAFMDVCRDEGRTASETLRMMMDHHVAARLSPARGNWRRVCVGGFMALGLGAAAAPTLARPLARAEFDRLDTNHDRTLDMAEFARLDRNSDGRIDLAEYLLSAIPPTGRTAAGAD